MKQGAQGIQEQPAIQGLQVRLVLLEQQEQRVKQEPQGTREPQGIQELQVTREPQE